MVKQNIRSSTKQFGSDEVKEFTCEISGETDQNSWNKPNFWWNDFYFIFADLSLKITDRLKSFLHKNLLRQSVAA